MQKKKRAKNKIETDPYMQPEAAESDEDEVLYPQELAEQMRMAKLEQDYEDALAQVMLEEAAKLQKEKEDKEKCLASALAATSAFKIV